MRPASPFTAVAAVEGWDAWFRWRDASGLRDRTIEATWWRVARAAAPAEGAQAEAWARRFYDAFSRWRLLPDAVLLRVAGTGEGLAPDTVLRAALDVAAFVVPSPLPPRLDLDAIADVAALAVRLLDDALIALRPDQRDRTGVRVGVLGVADALGALGVPYDSEAALQIAGNLAAALARGSRRGAIEVARERGGSPVPAPTHAHAHDGHDHDHDDDADRCGARLARLTAVVPQPRLACLANCASDALDPLPAGAAADPAGPGLLAQMRLRLAMQAWIDDPIDYPLLATRTPGDGDVQELARFAHEHGLAAPEFRHPARPPAG